MSVPCTKTATRMSRTSSRAASLSNLEEPDCNGRKCTGLAGRLWTPPGGLDLLHVPVSLETLKSLQYLLVQQRPQGQGTYLAQDCSGSGGTEDGPSCIPPHSTQRAAKIEDTMRGTDSQPYKTTGSIEKLPELEDTERRTP